MRSLNYVIGIILLLSFAVTGLAQDWQLIRYVTFEDGSNGGQSDLVYQDERFTLSGPFAPILHYGDHSLAFVASSVSPYTLQTPEPVGFQLQLTPDFEYRFSLSVETWSGNDIGFYLVGPDQQEILINGPVGTRQRDPSWTPGNVDLRDLYINGWDVIRISDTFTVPTAGEYYVYIRHYNSSNTYVGSSTYETMYDLYDLFKLEARALNNTTHLSFSQTTQSITEGSGTQLCVDISNPSSTFPTEVDIVLFSDASPHFEAYNTEYLVFPAGSSQQQCIDLEVPFSNENAPSTFYDFTLQNGVNQHQVVIGEPGTATVEVLQGNGLSIASPTSLSILEGSNTEICVQLQQSAFSYVTADLSVVGNASPHFSNNQDLSFVIPPGDIQACKTISIPFSSNTDPSSYQFVLQNLQGSNVVITSPSNLEIMVTPDPDNNCWESELLENFSSADNYNFSNLSHIANSGYVRTNYGANGSSSDACARATSLSSSYYFGLELNLIAGEIYQLSWNGKAGTIDKSVDLYLGTSANDLVLESGPYLIPQRSITQPGAAVNSTPFTVNSSGVYYVVLKKSSASSSSGDIRLDDLLLERYCGVTQPSTVYFSQQDLTVQEGNSFDICVEMTSPSGFGSTQVEVALAGNTAPHLASFSTTTSTFPAGDGSAQCFSVNIPANGNLDGDVTYTFMLQNPSGPNSPALIHPDTLLVTVIDDVDITDCNEWAADGDPIIFDNYAYALPGGFLYNSTSHMETLYPDYPGDKSFFGVYSTSFYLGIPYQLEPGYEYRLRWHSKGYRYGNLYQLPQNVDFGTSLATASPLAGTFNSNVENTSAVVNPDNAGQYYFFIKGASSISKSDIFLDDFILERRCKNTEINFVTVPDPVQAVEGNAFTVCLRIETPSPYQSTIVGLDFPGNKSPHFNNTTGLEVTFPAGSSADQCIDIPSTVFQGANPNSEYLLEINNVTGGIHPHIGEQDTKLLQVNESLDCWNPLEQQNFASATSSLSNIPNFVNNNSAVRSYYGATGTSGDRCARMQLNSSSKYIGFQKTLESGKYYQLGWNIKSEAVEKEVYLSVSSFINVDQPVGASRIIQAVDQTTPGQAIRFEYFTVPISGTYYLFIKSADGKSGYLKFDNFFLEERCPPAELFFTQSTASVEEGLPLEVCVNIANPNATEGSTAVVGFRGNQYPHFANSSSQTVYFPPASTEQQCVVFSSIGNGVYDESLPSYTLELKNPSGAHGPILGTPDEMLITLEDDVDLSICEWAGPDAHICLGDTVQLGVDYSQVLLFEDCVDEDYCFRWEPASEILFDAAYQQEPFVSPAQSTWFTIYMTDGQGNLFMDSVFVEVSDGPDFVIASDQTHLCTGDSLTLTANIQQGSGSYSYAWSTGATTPGTTVYTGNTYSLSITDLADGCTSSQSITIAEPNLSFAIAADRDFICTGSPNSILTVPGTDANNYQYLWSTSETSASISIDQAGEYQLTLTDVPYGCDTVLQYTVQDVDQELSIAIMATDTVLCENDTLLLSATIDGLTLDTEEVTYLWSNDQDTPTISASQAGTYSVTVTFGGVCSLNTSITLTEAMLDLAVISTSGENFACPESPLPLTSSTLDSTAITSWSWSTGETSETITVSEVGTFSLTVTDQNGCPFTADFSVAGCPTVVFLEQELVQIKDDETAEVCVGIVNPGTAETTVDLVFVDTKDPHFTAQPLSQTVTFAAGVNSLCLDFPSVRIEDADSVTVYALQLANATGGTNATIGLARETSIAVESAIRCQVEQDSLPVNCELSDTSTIVSDVPLISRLEKEDSFWAGDFEVEVVSSNGDGTFNGQGIIRIPYFNQVRVNVRMDNVQINEDCQMVAGEVVVLGVGAELLSDELQNALDDLLSTLDDIEDVITVIDEVLTTISDVVNTSSQIGEVLSEDWNVLHGGDPLFDEYPYLPDSLGQQLDEAILCYLVNPPSECSDQLAEVIDAVIAAINEMFDADYALRFNPYEPQSYGFDSLMYAPMASDYNRLVVANQPYNVAWKSVESGMSDHVLLDRDFADLPTDLTFEKNDRSTLQPENDNGKTRLPITGLAHEEVYQIYPVQNKLDENNDPVKKYAGKLNVISYDKKEVEVVLVPVNGAGANLTESDRVTIESSLNDIYQPAVASMTVELETNLTLDWFDGSLDTTGSSLLRVYNPEMLRINRGYGNANNNIDPNKYYIFLIASSEGDAIDGFMPFGKKNGYAIAGGNSSVQQLSRAIAHELGHGAFYLQHPFNEYNLDVGATNNLMDYGIGTHLAKYQWDIIHNPSVHISLFDDGEEAQLVSLYNVLEDLNHLVTTHTTNNEEKSYLTFMSNTGQPVILEADKISSLTFATGGESYIGTQNFVPIGTLTHFTVSRMLGDLEIVTSYTNCFDGLYYPNITSNFECAGDTYVNPTVDQNIQQLKPIVLRHSFKLGSPILHYIELGK